MNTTWSLIHSVIRDAGCRRSRSGIPARPASRPGPRPGQPGMADLLQTTGIFAHRIRRFALAVLFLSSLEYVQGVCLGPPGTGSGGSGVTVPQSYDPNEMAGPYGFGDPDTQRYVLPGHWMDYIVYFENLSNATAAAQEVFVDNPLSPYLDWSTLELGEVAFANQTEMGLAGKQSGTIEVPQNGEAHNVRVTFSLNPTNGLARWYLRVVDPNTFDGWPADPYAGFLHPNDETHRGEGHLAYRVRVRADAPADVVIRNAATIVFDYNEPIVTDPDWWNTVAGELPGPVSGGTPTNRAVIVSLQPTLAWDAAGLAQSYDVYLWRTNNVRPETPAAAGILSTFHILPTNRVAVGDAWNWQVAARNLYGATNGPVWQFTVRANERFTIMAQAGDHGRIEPAGAVAVLEGDTQVFRIYPDPYCYIVNVTAGTNLLGPVAMHAWLNTLANGTITAEFDAYRTVHDVPKWWLAQYGWTNDFEAAALTDHDGDGMAAWQEYYAGTDPTNPASVFKLIGVDRMPDSVLRMRWLPDVGERNFGVEMTSDAGATWTPVAVELNTNVWITPPGGGMTSQWFRINIQPASR